VGRPASYPAAASFTILVAAAAARPLRLHNKLYEARIREIVADAVDIEREFGYTLPAALVGINGALMSQYIKFITDYVLRVLWVQKIRSPMSCPQHVRCNVTTAASPRLCAQLSAHLAFTRFAHSRAS